MIEDWDEFVARVALICEFISRSISKQDPNLHVISLDEKTGILPIAIGMKDTRIGHHEVKVGTHVKNTPIKGTVQRP